MKYRVSCFGGGQCYFESIAEAIEAKEALVMFGFTDARISKVPTHTRLAWDFEEEQT